MIRLPMERDLERWAEMRHELWPNDSMERHLADVTAALCQPDVGNFVAEAGGKLIGFLEVSIRPNGANGCDSVPVAFVEGIWIDAAHRHKGVGRALVGRAEQWAKDRGINELGSDTEIENVGSQAAHLGWGFEETERVVYFRKKL